jgi:hypothetical protein
MIEVSNHGNMFGVWRPHGKLHAELAISFGQSERPVSRTRELWVPSARSIKIEFAQR